MTRETKEKLAASLTAETTELLPFLPYLLQDFWELGSEPDIMAKLIEKHVSLSDNTRILDLACGKGAVSVKIAKRLAVKVKGIDLIPSFIEFATQKAKEFNIGSLCEFMIADINDAVKNERAYDCVIFGAAGNILGNPYETISKLKSTIKTGGYILIDECYLPDGGKQEDVRYSNYDYLTEKQWTVLFKQAGLRLIETNFSNSCENLDSDSGMSSIIARASELVKKYPDKSAIFEGYIRSQQNEYDDIDSSLVAVTWILEKL